MTSQLDGDKPAQIAAREILPLLIWCAENSKLVTYGQISKWLRRDKNEGGKSGNSWLTHPLRYIGDALLKIGEEWNSPIPPLTVLVVDKDGKPRDGVNPYLKEYTGKSEGYLKGIPAAWKRKIEEDVCRDVFAYEYWDRLLDECVIERLDKAAIDTVTKILSKNGGRKSSSGGRSTVAESLQHKKLKAFIANNPHEVKFKGSDKGVTEYVLPSADAVDVVFKMGSKCLGVEVKSIISDDDDIKRGIYQCVKYQALLCAEQKADGDRSTAKASLVVEREISPKLKKLADDLKVDVFVCPVNKQE